MHGKRGAESANRFKEAHYRRIWISSSIITIIVSIIPLLIMTGFNYAQYHKALREESMHPIHLIASTSKRSLEYSLEERKNALIYIIKTNSIEKLKNQDELSKIKTYLEDSYNYFVDLALIDANGDLLSYAGPPALQKKLQGVNYSQEDWFYEMQRKGVYISDVFKGYRGNPHFIIAVRVNDEKGERFVLRATLDMEILNEQIPTFNNNDLSDAFIINPKGILQTKSKTAGDTLEKSTLPVPEYSKDVVVVEKEDHDNNQYVMGYAYIKDTPFIFIMTKTLPNLMSAWLSLRTKLIIFLIVSIWFIQILTFTISSVLVSRIREADLKHENAIHQVEYASKMASIGRLASGVAHEINNPLAVINEKAGLLHDLITMTDDFPLREKSLKIIDSIIKSVERGSMITHRLLGFARHLDVIIETIDIELLMNEVIGFLEKEAAYRKISINVSFSPNLPTIESDKGQIQQVFLNIINNALEAIKRDGAIKIVVEQKTADAVTIEVTDSGPGIDEKNIDRIFEPFFTTKNEGTGLGLAITYGIIKKLRGNITVKNIEGNGASFIITLPLKRIE
jgi:signal transduction histidine kinase